MRKQTSIVLNLNGVGIRHQKFRTLFELKMALFDNGDPEEFLVFIRNFNTTIFASEKLVASAKIQYLCMLVHGEELCQFDTLYTEVGSTT